MPCLFLGLIFVAPTQKRNTDMLGRIAIIAVWVLWWSGSSSQAGLKAYAGTSAVDLGASLPGAGPSWIYPSTGGQAGCCPRHFLAYRLHSQSSQEDRTMRAIVPVLVLLALLTGCARPLATDPIAARPDKKAVCESVRGKWNPLTQHCDTD